MLVELRIPNFVGRASDSEFKISFFHFFLRYGKRASDRLSFFWSGLNGLDLTPASNCLVFFFHCKLSRFATFSFKQQIN